MGVGRGGTGLSNLASGSYLVGNGTGAVTLKTPSEVASELGVEQEIFKVTITGDSSSGYTSDKTSTEITQAYRNGKMVIAIKDGLIYYMASAPIADPMYEYYVISLTATDGYSPMSIKNIFIVNKSVEEHVIEISDTSDLAPIDSPEFLHSISLGREANTTIGSNSVAVGYDVTASGNHSHAEGCRTIASGDYSHTEGNTTIASGIASHAEGYGTTASSFGSHAGGKFNKAMTISSSVSNNTGDTFVIGNGTSSSSLSNAFRVTYAGATYGLSAFNSSGADYAEFFEWKDQNPNNEDRIGYFVTLDGNMIRKANSDDYILGVISGQPCIIGNSDEDWLGRWEHDEFGRFIIEETEDKITAWREVEITDPDTGEIHTELEEYETGEVIKGWRYKANPDYDNTQLYIERKDRQEWDCVGLLGVLSVRDDGTCEVGKFAKVAEGGIATYAETQISNQTWYVIERISDNVIKILYR